MAECSICLEQLNEKNIAVLYCGHYYHVECILDWSNQKNNCPMCKCAEFDNPHSRSHPGREPTVIRRLTIK